MNVKVVVMLLLAAAAIGLAVATLTPRSRGAVVASVPEVVVAVATEPPSSADVLQNTTDSPVTAEEAASGEVLTDSKGRIINPVRMMDPPVANRSVFICPKFRAAGNDADRKKLMEHISKYSRYANDYCNTTGLMQMNIPKASHLQILSTIARIARVKQNDVVLDWGCGCGTLLNYLHLQFNTTGVGLDMTDGAIAFAKTHSQPRQTFCWMDGSDMSRFPSEAFDAIVSWGGVYHVRRTMVQCDIVKHFVRILKPGGVAFVGHVRTDKSQEYWKKNKCVPPNSSLVRYRDFKTFRQPSWKRHGFFSIVVSKNFAGGVAVPQEAIE